MFSNPTVVLWLVAVSQTAALSTRAITGCNTKADVTFLIDSSDSVGQINFNTQLDFVKSVVNNLNVGNNEVHVSALTFSSGVHNQFYLNNYVAKNDVLNAVSGIRYVPGNTDTADALKFASQESFSPSHGARGDVPHIAVLLTDGPSITKDITKLQAQTAKDNNMAIFTVGVGAGVDVDELMSVSSNPDSRYSMFADNYGTLNSLSDLLATKLCNELPPNPNLLPQPTGCLNQADVVFMVDSSTSVGNINLQKSQAFMKSLISNMNIGQSNVHVGVMQYSGYPSLEFPLSMYNNRGDALHAVETLQLLGGGTNTADAIKYTTEEMFSAASGARSNVPRIAIMLTDGGTLDSAQAIHAADLAKQAGIGLNVVAIGNGVNQQEVNQIASSPSGSHVTSVSNFDQLQSVVNQVMQQACTVRDTYNFANVAQCADKINNCAEYGTNVCNDYKQWAADNCKMSCGYCPYQYSMYTATCSDKLTNCVTYGKDACSGYGNWARDNCQQYCGFCGNNTVSSGFYGMCSYKGKMYQTGQKWTDGCDYECVCRDGSKGDYQCYNRCPLYYNLPSMCTLVRKPGQCCLTPVCNFNPSVSKFTNTGSGMTSTGIPVCVYKNKQYYQGQTWKDGCQYQCTCMDAAKGQYQCESLCPTYSVLPSGCHMQQMPGECCQKPICEFDQQQGSFSGYGVVSSQGVDQNIQTPKICMDKATNCRSFGRSVCTTYAQWATDNCMKYCDMCQNQIQSPGPNDVCIYEGKQYVQGQRWSTGCSASCTCENAKYGYYRCVDACPIYNNLPAGCNVIKKRGECCPRVECQTGSFLSSSANLNTIGNGGLIHVSNPSQPLSPGPISSSVDNIGAGGTGFTAPTLKGCLYKGSVYVQDQTWEDGCQLSCVCQDAQSGHYLCREKCPSYTNLASSCVMITDPNEPCCTKPKCGLDVATGQIPIPVPSYSQGTSGNGVVKPPMPTVYPGGTQFTQLPGYVILNSTGLTPAPPTAPSNIQMTGYCIYKGKQYQAAETWEDGCDYNCVCDDGLTGHYTCIEKCRVFNYVPNPYCHLISDPKSPCCKIPECAFLPHNNQIEGQRTTQKPRGNYCEYNGRQYQQGQTWYDGCSYRCTCEDSEKGIYRCVSRCPEILHAEPGCTYITDPRDPSCCQIPDCTPKNASTGPNPSPNPIPPKVYQGQTHNSPGKCVYKGVEYGTGEIWQDGCDYTCECIDAGTGQYECTDRCPQYTGLPDNCRMVNDFANPCCKKPKCDIPSHPGMVTGLSGVSTTTPNPILPQTLPPSQQYCVYKNAQYLQGQTWEDGCSYRCRCDDSSRGIYTCNERCAEMTTLKPGCRFIADPDDDCCLVQICPQPTPMPGQTTQVPTVVPALITGKVNVPLPSVQPGQPLPTPKFPLGFCVYKGVTYTQGQKWDDGCDYTCECYDSDHGKYRCTSKCPKYVDIPPSCRLSKNPADPCCQIVECAVPTPGTTPVPTPAGQTPPAGTQGPNLPNTPAPTPGSITNQPTPSPAPKNVCEYKGKTYIQGQQWYDGCDFLCVCEDGMTGVYRCNERCPTFAQPPASCTLEADPRDPLCCKIPKCPSPGNNYETAPPLIHVGGRVTPSPTPSPSYTPRPTPYNPYNPNPYNPNPNPYNPNPNPYNTPYPLPPGETYPPIINPTSTPRPTPQVLIPGNTYPPGTPYVGGTYPPGTVPTQPPMTYTPYPSGTYPPNYKPNPSNIPTFVPYQTYPPNQTPYPQGTYPPGVTVPPPTPFPGVTYPPGYTPQTTRIPYNPVVHYYTQKPLVHGGTYPPNETPYPGGTYPTGTVPPRIYTPYPGATYPPNYTINPYQTQPSFVPGKTYPTNKTPYPGGTYPPGQTYPRPTPYVGGTYPPNYTPAPTPTPQAVYPVLVGGQTYPPNKTPYPGATYPTGTVPHSYTPYYQGTYPPSYTFKPGQTPIPLRPGQTYPTNMTPYPSGTYPTKVTVPQYTPFIGGTYPPRYTPGPYQKPSTFIPGETYPTNKTPYPYGTYPPGTAPMGTPYPSGTYPPGFTFQKPQTTPSRIIPGQTYPPNMTPYPSGTYPPGYTAPPLTPYPQGTYPTGYTPFIVVTNYPHPNGGTIHPPGATAYPNGPTYPPNLTYPTYTPYPGGTYPPYNPSPVVSYFTNPPLYPQGTYPPNKTPYPYGTYPPGTVKPVPYPEGTYPPNYTPNPYQPQPQFTPGQTYPPYMTPYPQGTYPPHVTVPLTPYPGGTYPPYNPNPINTYFTNAPLYPQGTYPPNKTPYPYGTYPPGTVKPVPYPDGTYPPNYTPNPYQPQPQFTPGQTYPPYMTPYPQGTYPPLVTVPNTPYPGGTYPPYNPNPVISYFTNAPLYPQGTYPPNKTPYPNGTYPPGTVAPVPYPSGTYPPNYTPNPYQPQPSFIPGQTYPPYLTPYPSGTYPPQVTVPFTPYPLGTYPPGFTNAPPSYTTLPPIPTPGPIAKANMCVYKGKSYSTGQKWQDGCDYDCVCEDGMNGIYKCTEKCPRITNLAPGCTLVSDIYNPCCKKPYCPPTLTPPPVTITPPPQSTMTNGKPAVCTYNGVAFKQGETWNDGCDLVCICEDGMTGFYRCNDRCPQYQQTPGCTLETDPKDICCKRPVCHVDQMTPPPITPTPQPKPGEPAPTPTPSPLPYTLPIPTGQSYGSGPNGGHGCMYKGIAHDAGQTWQDGCLYNCECLDQNTGRYRCAQRCPNMNGVVPPPNCQIVNNPNDPCCKMVQCRRPTEAPLPKTTPVPNPFPTGSPVITNSPLPGNTPVPPQQFTTTSPTRQPAPKNICIMSGKYYTQGQQWFDGCNQVCVCEDGRTGYYRCSQRCKTYNNLPTSCTLVPDPSDPQCCQIPQCATPTLGPSGQPVTITGVPGQVTGYGLIETTPPPQPTTPNPYYPVYTTFNPLNPSPTTQVPTTPAPVCVYNGIAYKTGQKWQDGCKYNCVCENGMVGLYKCTERCPNFPRTAPGCTFKQDPNDFCCSIQVCEATTTPAPIPGQTTAPPPTPQPFCLYNGIPYIQGQTWDEGCSKKCRCDDAMNNLYTCFDRCKQYPDLPAGCTKQTDPNDPCCQIPVCTTPAPTPYNPLNPTTPPNQPTTHNSYPSPLPGGEIIGQNPVPQNPFEPSPSHFCEYKGSKYHTGDTWQDGCDYVCECLDDMSGRYKCTERCPTYPVRPSCYLVADPKDQCCKVMYCPPTQAPQPVTTPQPQPLHTNPNGHTNSPHAHTTLVPTPSAPSPLPYPTMQPGEVCIFMGRTYTQGQTWYDGCDRRCVCVDGRTGHYECNQRCPQYQQNPACTLIPDPRDPTCCKIPQCPDGNAIMPVIEGTQTPSPQPTTPIKLIFGPNGGPVIFGTAGPTTPAQSVCVYNGQFYKQGDKWQDGCKYVCECVDSMTGRYKCVERCTNLNSIPLTCTLKYNPEDPCCPKPDCPLQIAPTPVPGGTLAPTKQPPPQPEFCVYNGVPYRQGQTWNVGCEKVCRCDDAHTGHINCDDRCPSYPAPKQGCQLVTDPSDQCCQAPVCIDVNSTNPFTVITGDKGTFYGTQQQPQNPQNPGLATSSKACVYHGKIYKQGQKWDDGCLFQCECIDEHSGRYKCTERCARTPQVPSYCTLVQDPNDQCCQTLYCPVRTTPGPTKPGQHGHPITGTPVVPGYVEICVYNGQAYRQGQQWYDGCDKICRCENATSGFYRCQQRCTFYNRVPSACTLVPDPNDPTCCKVPDCPVVQPGVAPSPGTVRPLNPVYGQVTGNGIVPTTPVPTIMVNGQPQPGTSGQNTDTTPKPGCFYKGQIYTQGQQWDDGCQYHCECVNQMTGQYKCTEKCQRYPNLPSYCQLVKDNNNPCCAVPYCGNPNTPLNTVPPQYQTFLPTTRQPNIAYIPGSGSSISGTNTPVTNVKGFCVYKGVYYKQGQSWDDGCDKTCTCDDVINNLYSCRARCPTFDNIPSNCHLVADQNDPCCVVPNCNVIPTHQTFTGSGIPPQTTALPVVVPTPVQSSFTGSSNNGPGNPLYPNQQTGITGNGEACIYKGKIYTQGQTWRDGCQLDCECYDAARGQYRCKYHCPQYYNLPWFCRFEPDPQDQCCRKARCDPNLTTPQPVVTTPRPTQTVTYPKVTATMRPQDLCRYTDYTVHAQGSSWEDGCMYRCTCLDATQNSYKCTARCRIYTGLPSYCTLAVDPKDPCCRVPVCNSGGINFTPLIDTVNGSATPAPNQLNVLPVGTVTEFHGSNEIKPGAVNPYQSSGGYGACAYKGKVYQQGQSWSDGCQYTCTCENAAKGEYKCISKCPQLPLSLPTYCRKVTIAGQCCPKLSCDIPGTNNTYHPPSEILATPAPTDGLGNVITPGVNYHVTNGFFIPTQPAGTQAPTFPGKGFPILQSQMTSVRDQCVFANKAGEYLVYNEGEKWNDGCDYTCECKDGASGYYECLSSCPIYNNLPSSRCYLVRVDGQCCSEPRCQLENGAIVNPLKVQTSYPIVPSQNGGYVSFRPDYNYAGSYVAGQNTTGSRNVCIYKGRIYQPGQSWSDGCDFNCNCENGNKGQFTCSPRCPVYVELPSFCKLDTIQGECCKRLNCPETVAQTPAPTQVSTKPTRKTCDWCRDAINNCEAYGQSACKAPYESWAKRNCPNYCNLCDTDCYHTPVITTPVSLPTDCKDALSNCAEYGKDSCVGIFADWALTNCKRFCNLCSSTTVSGCHDLQPAMCQSLKSSVCSNSAYEEWANKNCQLTCNRCPGQTVTTPIPSTCTDANGVTRQHGESWTNGCSPDSKNFTCIDGKIKTLQLCPIFNLPEGWRLVTVPGQCCPVVQPNPIPKCHYGGNSYNQGETWSDGCKLTCSCTSAKDGLYQCQQKCPEWQLPDVCQWIDPAPGKCCKQPVCPAPYVIQGYPNE